MEMQRDWPPADTGWSWGWVHEGSLYCAFCFYKFLQLSIKRNLKVNEASPNEIKAFCDYHIRIKTAGIQLHIYPDQIKATIKDLSNLKTKKNFQQTLYRKPTLSFEIGVYVAQKSLLTSFKAQAFITFSYRSSSYFFPNKILLLTVPGNIQGC